MQQQKGSLREPVGVRCMSKDGHLLGRYIIERQLESEAIGPAQDDLTEPAAKTPKTVAQLFMGASDLNDNTSRSAETKWKVRNHAETDAIPCV